MAANPKILKLAPFERSYEFLREDIDEEARTVAVSFSSEYPVERHFGMEILDHSPESVDLSRLNNSAPVLVNHDPDRQVGVVESATISNKRGSAVLRFGRSTLAQEIFQDVQDSIRTGISTRYRITELTPDGKDTFRASWFPFEISVASIPADPSVGKGRADEISTNDCKVINMNEETQKDEKQAPEQKRTPEPAPGITVKQRDLEVANAKQNAVEAERTRMSRLMEIGKAHGAEDMAREYVAEGKSVDELRAGILESLGKLNTETRSPTIGMSNNEVQRFSFVRAINALANPRDHGAQKRAEFELEVSRTAAEHLKKQPQGILVPYDVLIAERQLNVTTPTEGAELVATDLRAQSFIELLRNRSVLARNGATMLDGLVGNVAIPRQTGAATLFWVAEGVDTTVSLQAFDQVPLTPRTASAATEFTRRLMLQSTPSVETLVRNDLARVVAEGVDLAGLYGTGTDQPLGVKGQTGVNTENFGVATKPTWANIVNMETQVAAANADVSAMAYITDATGRGYAKTTLKTTAVAGYLWDGGEVNGYRADVSNQVTATDWWFGVWSQVLMGFWSGIDILVDPYSNSLSGTIRVVAMQDMDIGVRHPESFTYGAEVA